MDERILWDNANISESYAGVTTPLTTSFAMRVYREVYRGMAHASGLPWRTIQQYDTVFSNLVGARSGRLYYHMLNWYRFASLFPGYRKNVRNLERMLTVPQVQTLLRETHAPWWFRFFYPFVLLYRVVFFRRDIERFQRRVETILRDLNEKASTLREAEQLWVEFNRFADTLLPMWHITTDNDFLLMTYVGEKQDGSLLGFTWQTTLPRQYSGLQQLQGAIHDDQTAHTLLVQKRDVELWNYLCSNPPSDLGKVFGQYLKTYGARLPNELKLETPPLQDQPSVLFNLIRAYTGKNSSPISSQKIDFGPDKQASKHNSQSRIERHIAYREQTRLLRARVFSAVRTLFLAIGKDLKRHHQLKASKDIFWCTLEEIPRIIDGTMSKELLHTKIQERQNQFAAYAYTPAPDRFFEVDGKIVEDLSRHKKGQGTSTWKGIGASPGTIRGRAVVLDFPDASLVQKGDILVARHTDPGWTPLFGLVSGVAVEYGGILSHASIVSRECGIPCVVQLPGITQQVQTGQMLEVNASTGVVKILR